MIFSVAIISALLAFILIGWLVSRKGSDQQPQDVPRAGKRILIDGSNVMYWKDEAPKIQTVIDVVNHLVDAGYDPYVIFDASAGYRVSDRYRDDAYFALALGRSAEQVLVVPKGASADTYLLSAARGSSAKIVTNDKFRDWAGEYPEVRKSGHLVRGGVRSGQVWLNFNGAKRRKQRRRPLKA